MLQILSDPALTGLLIVTTPEEMPVNETIELSARVSTETTVQLAAIVVNRVLPELFGRGEEEVFDHLSAPSLKPAVDKALGGDSGPLFAGARLAVTLRRTRALHLDHLRESVDPDLPLLYVPYLFSRTHGLRSTRSVADALAAELGY
jgi:anion-transporting  ArsA/GET3 family ATPase